MAVISHIYGNIIKKAFSKEIDFLNDDIKIMLCTSSYNPDAVNHSQLSSITNEVTSGNGYTAGGISLQNKLMSFNGTLTVDADDPVWVATTITGARYGVIYDNTATNKPLICYIDFGAAYSSVGGDFKITLDSSGIFKISVL